MEKLKIFAFRAEPKYWNAVERLRKKINKAGGDLPSVNRLAVFAIEKLGEEFGEKIPSPRPPAGGPRKKSGRPEKSSELPVDS